MASIVNRRLSARAKMERIPSFSKPPIPFGPLADNAPSVRQDFSAEVGHG